MERLHLTTLPRNGACHVRRPLTLAALQPRTFRINHLRPSVRVAAGRSGSLDDDGLEGDDFLPPTNFADQVDLDEDEAAILLGSAEDPLEKVSGFIDSDDEGDPEEMARRRGLRARGRVVDGADEDIISLDAFVADVQRGANSRSSQPIQASSSPDGEEDALDGETSDSGTVYPPMPERRRNLPDLLRAAGYSEAAETAPNVEMSNIITCNSENGAEGALYVCVPCEDDVDDPELDGHFWADESADMGAVAVLASRPLPDCLLPVVQVDDTLKALGAVAAELYDRPSKRISTIAFVGSYGKTTCSWLARGILEESDEIVGMIGDSEYAIGTDRLTPEGDLWTPDEEDSTSNLERSSPFRLTERSGKYDLPSTTPDALHLQKVLAGIADRGGSVAMVEVSPGLAADGRVGSLHASVLVFTNIDPAVAAADPEGSDAYVERVSAMFEGLDENQTAIINLDDPLGPMLARLVEDSGAQLLTYGAKNKEADIYAERVKPSIWETEMLVRTPVGRLEIILPLVGSYNVANALAAVAVGLASGVKLVSIVAGIEAVDLVPGRTEVIDEGQAFPVIIDSAKTPEQLGRLVDEVKEAGARRTILVVGCPGGTTPEHRAAIGQVAHYKADVVFFTNDSPGLDPPPTIISEIVSGLPEEVLARHAGSYFPWLQDVHRTPQWFESWILRYQSEVGRYIIEDRFSAIRVAIGMAKARDVVLVAGRGQDDRMVFWDGIPPPRSDAERAVGEAAKFMAESVESSEYVEETKWEAIDRYYEEREAQGLPVERGTTTGWFDDSLECRNAIARLPLHLNKLKDLDRSTLPWTRYPEEREHSGLSVSMGMAEATGVGNLDQYLRNVVDGIREASLEVAEEPVGDSDGEESEDEEEEEELEGAF